MKKHKGSLTVEACISFTVFMMLLLTMFYIIRIVYVYGVIQHSITQSAKEISGYSYIYQVSGMGGLHKEIEDATAGGKKVYNTTVDDFVNAYGSLTNMKDIAGDVGGKIENGNFDAAVEKIQNSGEDYEEFKSNMGAVTNTVKDIVSSPAKMLKSLASVFVSETTESIKTLVGGEIVRAMSSEYIAATSGGGKTADQVLNALQVEGGLYGLDFSNSKFFSDGETIDIVVCYTIKSAAPINVMPTMNLMNRVTVRGWNGESIVKGYGGGDDKKETEAEKKSVWELGDIDRNERLQKELGILNLPRSCSPYSYYKDGVAIASTSMNTNAEYTKDKAKIKANLIKKCEKIENFEEAKNGKETIKKSDIKENKMIIILPTDDIGNADSKKNIEYVVNELKKEYPNIKFEIVQKNIEENV